jgi:hypothetical protein
MSELPGVAEGRGLVNEEPDGEWGRDRAPPESRGPEQD